MYFQLRGFPCATHCRVVFSRSARVAGRFASVIQSMYSRLAEGEKAAHSAPALALFLRPAARSAGVAAGFFPFPLARWELLVPDSLSFTACLRRPMRIFRLRRGFMAR